MNVSKWEKKYIKKINSKLKRFHNFIKIQINCNNKHFLVQYSFITAMIAPSYVSIYQDNVHILI